MNKVFLIGNLTRDPEMAETRSGVAVCHFTIAVNRSYTDANGDRQTDYFTCTAWKGTAEAIGEYCSKGSKVSVLGNIQIRDYEDNHGSKRTAVDVIVQDVEFLSPKEKRGQNDYYDRHKSDRRTPQSGGNGKRKPTLESFDDDGDIPF